MGTEEVRIQLRLYVSPGSPNSTVALRNLETICKRHLADRVDLEVVDLYEEPSRALEDGVMMTPMLVLASLDPPVRIIGNLNDPAPVLQALEVVPGDYAD
ncbi:MAG: circadian clock KaiB family protein [Pseudohongiellaceae bacterium]